MRTLGTAGDGRRGGKRTGTVIGDGDRHGTHGVVVGVTGLAIILLGYGVREGLAGVSLRKLDLMASQDVDQADRCLCRRRGLEVVGSGSRPSALAEASVRAGVTVNVNWPSVMGRPSRYLLSHRPPAAV